MLAFVEPYHLVFSVHPQPDHHLDDHEDDQCHHRTINHGYPNRYQLRQQLARVSIQQAFPGLINRRIRKYSSEDCTNCAADSMYAEGVQGVIIAELRLQPGNSKKRDDACRQSDHDRAGYIYKTRCGGDRNQSRLRRLRQGPE